MSRMAKLHPSSIEQTVRELVSGQADFVEITTPSSINDELEIRHGLGRIPRGMMIVKTAYAFGSNLWGTGDTEWTTEAIYARFPYNDATITVAIF